MIVETNILDNATLWVAISFIIFVILVFKPIKNMMLTNLDNKIAELKSQLSESKKLKEDAEKLLTEHNKKYKETLIKIKKINEDAIYESKIIKKKVEEDIKNSLLRKEKGFKQLSSQMELKVREDLKNEIIRKTIYYTEFKIKKKLKKSHNSKLINESLSKLTSHLS
jgi:F-type H+-transporting ATPase subunit b